MQAAANTSQSTATARRYWRGAWVTALILASGFTAPVRSAGPPSNLAKRVAVQEAVIEEARRQYAFTQKVSLTEFDKRGLRMGQYQETREVVFSESGERIERAKGKPQHGLQRIRLTEEDYRDFREVQPFLFSEDTLWMYRTRVIGEEDIDGEPCWIMTVTPKQILDGQRLFEGRFWISQADEAIVRMAGKAVPQHYGKNENLFPAFTTIRAKIDGKHWFPVSTIGDDVLPFRSGPQRVRLEIAYEGYQRFSADSQIRFDEVR